MVWWNKMEKDKKILAAKAHALAVSRHVSQKHGRTPYVRHLALVVSKLKDFVPASDDEFYELIAAAWLHDVVEDTKTTIEEIKMEFGDRVAELVWAVTDEAGRNRMEKKRRTYPKIRATRRATLIKLCDRLANVEMSRAEPRFFAMYKGEHDEFKAALFDPSDLENRPLWEALDVLLGRTS
jgi:(p)ppGpp synthase/HD superfamily hydrolase